jgi:putative FmdB family regulatory protein
MPMYDFECQGCGHVWEMVASLDEMPPCPECKATQVERLMGAPKIAGKAGLHFKSSFKGSGRPPPGSGP